MREVSPLHRTLIAKLILNVSNAFVDLLRKGAFMFFTQRFKVEIRIKLRTNAGGIDQHVNCW